MSPTDETLVAAFQAGDLSAFDVLVHRWERKIHGAIYRVLGSEDDARDLCQEAFLKAYRALPSFKGEARFSSWLYQIAINLCRDRMRRRKGRTLVSLDQVENGTTLGAHGPSALDLVEERDLARRVAAAVASLPEEQREVLVLKEYQGLTFLEIAETLELPISTVKTRLYRGLGQLRARLEQQGVRGAAPAPLRVPEGARAAPRG
jgi:RNA polymerase sigma-70 factor (ECF subfamily)